MTMQSTLYRFAQLACLAGALHHAAPALAEAPVPARPVTVVASDDNWAGKYTAQVQFDDYLSWRRTRPADMLFIGDSITEQFRWGPGYPVWKKRYEERAVNFGRSADRTQHVLWRLDHLDIDWIKPKTVVLMIGTNNQTETPEDIASGVKAVIARIQARFPQARIVLLSILPNARQTAKMAATNPLLAPLADGRKVIYLDLAAKFTPQGDTWKGLVRDRLHLSTEGYEMWAAELDAVLRQPGD